MEQNIYHEQCHMVNMIASDNDKNLRKASLKVNV